MATLSLQLWVSCHWRFGHPLAVLPRFAYLKIITVIDVYRKLCKLYRIGNAKASQVNLFLQRGPFLTFWGVHSRLFTCVHLCIFSIKMQSYCIHIL